MKSYILYGFLNESLDIARMKVEAALSITLHYHESLYHGGKYYRLNDVGEEHILLQYNAELEDEFAEDEFQEYSVLLYLNETQRAEKLHDKLIHGIPHIMLLRREDLSG